MLEYDRIDMSIEIDADEVKESHRCFIGSYDNFLKVNFRLQPKVCSGYHNLIQKLGTLLSHMNGG